MIELDSRALEFRVEVFEVQNTITFNRIVGKHPERPRYARGLYIGPDVLQKDRRLRDKGHDWYQTDDVYVLYFDNGYYLYHN